MEIPKLPVVVDPETGLLETVGKGRVAIIKTGEATVSRVVQLPEANSSALESSVLDEHVARGDLRHSF